MAADGPVAIHLDDVHIEYKVYADSRLTMRRLVSQRFSGRESTVVHEEILHGSGVDVSHGLG